MASRPSSRAYAAGFTAAAIMAVGGLALAVSPAHAQTRGAQPAAQPVPANPAAANLLRMGRRVTIELTDQRLQDVITFIGDITGAELEPLWRTDTEDGLDPERRVNLKVTNMPALTFLEKVLERAQTDFQQNTWQLTTYGSIQIGTKDRLNRYKRMEIYPVNDLLTDLPRFYDAPQIDLQSVLQQSQGGGGGGGQSPFTQDQQNQRSREEEDRLRQERVQRLLDIITTFVEPEQWVDNGGDGGTIRYFQGSLIINAPDYMHRQINGYPFWGSGYSTRTVNGRRYVSLNMDTGISTVDGFGREPVTVVVGGRLVRSGDPGPGGSATPAPENQQPGGGSGGDGGSQQKPAPPK